MNFDDNLQKCCLYLVAEWESNFDGWYVKNFLTK